MKRFIGLLIAAAFAVGSAGCTTPSSMQASSRAGAPAPAAAPQGAAAQQPWTRADAIVRATGNDISRGGIQAIRPHVMDLEQALVDGKQVFDSAANGSSGVVLTDGPTETLGALLRASTMGRQVSAIANPYPMASFFLGTYYNEIGRSADALRALDAGLLLTPLPGGDFGESVPLLLSERGAALSALKRYQDSLDNFDRALKIEKLNNEQRAIMQRGRGFALIELGRLEEAEQSYRDSLKSEPNNARAQNELTYIGRLRAGGPTAPGGLSVRMPQMSR